MKKNVGIILGIIGVVLMSIAIMGILMTKQEPHWSYEACLKEIMVEGAEYEVKEIAHTEVAKGNDEIYCFEITITYEDVSTKYICFSVVSGDEVIYVDCDKR